jgi:hypothetical protein
MLHNLQAQMTGYGLFFEKRTGDHERWYDHDTRCEGASVAEKTDCDEYPYNKTVENKQMRPMGVSLKVVNAALNRSLGSRLGQFFDDCGVDATNPDKRAFGVIALPSTWTTQWSCGNNE